MSPGSSRIVPKHTLPKQIVPSGVRFLAISAYGEPAA